jgi:hypothetical protein
MPLGSPRGFFGESGLVEEALRLGVDDGEEGGWCSCGGGVAEMIDIASDGDGMAGLISRSNAGMVLERPSDSQRDADERTMS